MPFKITSLPEYHREYRKSIRDPAGFWADKASAFIWRKKWDEVTSGDFLHPPVRWFDGGQLNITENCLDRHIPANGDKAALIWEPDNPAEPSVTVSYQQLLERVCAFANVLQANGVQKGDRVGIYLPMVPELAVAILACARIGAIHTVVFAGFSAVALADRLSDVGASLLITSDGSFRGGQTLNLKNIVDVALKANTSVQKVLVLKRTNQKVSMKAGRDAWLNDQLETADLVCKPTEMASEDTLFILYTSGSTGKPKGVVHTTAGYMVFAQYSFENVFQTDKDSVYWCTADIGWITGHTYLLYGPLLAGVTTVMHEGTPTYPKADRFWEIIEKHQVSHFYTAPTVVRMLMTFPDALVAEHHLDSLKVLGSVGEPINEAAWNWLYSRVGRSQCSLVDTWWQTETGGISIAPLAGITAAKPTYATLPLPGIDVCLIDNHNQEITVTDKKGDLCIRKPWPAMLRGIYNNPQRYHEAYFSQHPGFYFTGDGATKDTDGNYKILGRVDDVINVSGHRFGTAELENSISSHPAVIEAAVVGVPHPIKGQGIYVYVVVRQTGVDDERLRTEICATVADKIGLFAQPDTITFVPALPKTRSGKITRRILRNIASGEASDFGDTSTLLDSKLLAKIIKCSTV